MWKDEIVEEIRKVRREHAAAHGFNLRRIAEDIRLRQQASGRRVVTLPPKPARRIKRASVGEK